MFCADALTDPASGNMIGRKKDEAEVFWDHLDGETAL